MWLGRKARSYNREIPGEFCLFNQIYNFQGLLSSFPASTAHALTGRLGFDSFSMLRKNVLFTWKMKAALYEGFLL